MATERPFTYTRMFETVRTISDLLAPDDLEYVSEIPQNTSSELVVHLSCMAHYTPHIPVLAQKILRSVGRDCLIVGGPENCCSELHKYLGDTELERQTAKVAMAGFRKAKPRKVVSICPDCDEQFTKHGVDRLPYEHTNMSTLLIEFLPELTSLFKPIEKKIVLHRHDVNAMRSRDANNVAAILEAIPGLQFLDAQHAAGPGIHCQTLYPMSPEAQNKMFEEAAELGAEAIVMPYHSCYRQHVKMQLTFGVEVHHYFNLVAMALGIPFTEPFKEMRLLNSVDAVLDALRPKIERFGYDEQAVRGQVQRAIFC
jgi:hypothetical protein